MSTDDEFTCQWSMGPQGLKLSCHCRRLPELQLLLRKQLSLHAMRSLQGTTSASSCTKHLLPFCACCRCECVLSARAGGSLGEQSPLRGQSSLPGASSLQGAAPTCSAPLSFMLTQAAPFVFCRLSL